MQLKSWMREMFLNNYFYRIATHALTVNILLEAVYIVFLAFLTWGLLEMAQGKCPMFGISMQVVIVVLLNGIPYRKA